MISKLATPLGEVMVYIDDKPVEFEAMPFLRDIASLREQPPAASYRLTVPCGNGKRIRCAIMPENPGINVEEASGERYLCTEFSSGHIMLTVGAEDENTDFETAYVDHGMEYVLRRNNAEVCFGVAWVTDHDDEYDIRTYLAADPCE